MLSIRTNLSSLIAQNNLLANSNKLNQAIERMTTGSKINHAKDNAANYSISTNMQTRMSALRVAEDNTLQAMEMMSTTIESLNQINDKLARMRALSVQSMNGTFGDRSLDAINAEANSILKEINRINECAEYDGVKLFNTGKAEVTNAGKELELNDQGFLQEVVKVDTTGMTPLGSMADDATLAVGEYTISDVNELVQLARMANAGLIEAGSTFVLNADLDIGSYCKSNVDANGIGGWEPIELSNSTFEGNGHTIKGLYINRNVQNQGFFSSAIDVKNLKLVNVDIKSCGAYSGAIAGYRANAYNCVVQGKIESTKGCIGGIIGGYSSGYAKYCYVNADIKGGNNVGGIMGHANYASISNCVSEGSVSGISSVGGILGSGDQLTNSKSFMLVKGDTAVGGICGKVNRNQSGNHFSGIVQGNSDVGGIAGVMQRGYTISDSLMEGEVVGISNVGLLLGKNTYTSNATVKNSIYYIGKSTTTKDVIGDSTNVITENNTDITIPCNYSFQVGVTGENLTSSVYYTTYIEFAGLNELLVSGIDSEGCLAKIDELVNVVSLKQTELGTMENRLMSVLDEISTQYENLASSYSTIHDADIADVSSSYIKQQIIQQAGASLLASTQNIQYQNVMGLLQSLQR